MRNVKVAKDMQKIDKAHLLVFDDASKVACSAVTIAVIEHSSGVVKGLLTLKSRISKRNNTIAKLELVNGHMAANMKKNLHFPLISRSPFGWTAWSPYTGSATQENHGRCS